MGIEREFFKENQACISIETPTNEKELLNQLINNQKSDCKEVRLFKLSLSELNLIANIVFLLICVHIIRNEKNKKIEEVIRVDHAGERGAVNIYDGQLLALQLLKSDPDMESKISEMKEHEKEHLKYFEQQLAERKFGQQCYYQFGTYLVKV